MSATIIYGLANPALLISRDSPAVFVLLCPPMPFKPWNSMPLPEMEGYMNTPQTAVLTTDPADTLKTSQTLMQQPLGAPGPRPLSPP